MSKLESAQRTIAAVREKTDSCIVFCSLGKDSLVTLDMVAPHFDRVVCVFMYFVPHLEHIERWVTWVKARYPKVEFMQVPHWNLSYILRGGLYCIPNPKVKLLKLADVVRSIRLKTGISYVFLGMKKADSMNRRLMLKGFEQDEYISNGQAYPLADWTQKGGAGIHEAAQNTRADKIFPKGFIRDWFQYRLLPMAEKELSAGFRENLQGVPSVKENTL